MSKFKQGIRFLSSVVKQVVCFYCIGNTAINTLGAPSQVDGQSMKPTLANNDYVFVNFWAFRRQPLRRGDIVAFISHRDPDKFVVKRIIALEGDIVKNDKSNPSEVIIPLGHCWVEGDNFKVSEDSIKYGPISTGLVLGKVTHRLYPDFKRLEQLDRKGVTHGGTLLVKLGQDVSISAVH